MQVIVATGFIASNPQGQVTTLKRNGSDYSATIMGALFQASHITIWTDVDGVYSADPRKVRHPVQMPGWNFCMSCQQCCKSRCSGKHNAIVLGSFMHT